MPNLREARLEGADLYKTVFTSAKLAFARSSAVNASFADFTGADWGESVLAGTFDGFFGCAGTKLDPEYEKFRPKHWYPEPLELDGWDVLGGRGPTYDRREKIYRQWRAAREAGRMPDWVNPLPHP